jgi:hypothetical protein
MELAYDKQRRTETIDALGDGRSRREEEEILSMMYFQTKVRCDSQNRLVPKHSGVGIARVMSCVGGGVVTASDPIS